MEYVKKLAVADSAARREALLSILRAEGIPFALHRARENEHWVENIMVSLDAGEARLVVGAHYDAVEGSTGANDNASGVSVLIRLAKRTLGLSGLNMDLVFFDREEYRDHGSEAYIRQVGAGRIAAMVNVDTCGYGDALAVITRGNERHPRLKCLFSEGIVSRFAPVTTERLMVRFGDDDTFDKHHIPCVAITVMPRAEAEGYKAYVEKLTRQAEPTPREHAFRQSIGYVKTMHNGPLDSIDAVSSDALDMVEGYLVGGLLGL